MSQIHYEETSLDQVLDRAEVVAVVRRAEPPYRAVEEPSVAPTWEGGSAPPFRYRLARWIVEEVLRGGAELVGQVVEVEPADLDGLRGDHLDYYVEGLSSHPIYDVYVPRREPDETRQVVFLCTTGEGFAFCVGRAVEHVDLVGELREMLAARPYPGELLAADSSSWGDDEL